MGQRAHHARKQDGCRGLPRTDPETLRARAHRRDAARERRLHRFVCRQPLHGTRDTDLHLGLRAGGIRHRSDHGRAGARLARLCLRPSFRAGNHARRRRRRHQQGVLRRQGGQTHQLRFSGRHGGQGGDRKDVRRHRAARTGQTAGQLPAARRHLLAPALLGRTLPDLLSRRNRPPAAGIGAAARTAARQRLRPHRRGRTAAGPRSGVDDGRRRSARTVDDARVRRFVRLLPALHGPAQRPRARRPRSGRILAVRSTSTWAASNMRRAT